MILISCFFLAFFSLISTHACEQPPHPYQQQSRLKNWVIHVKTIFERDDLRDIRYDGDNLWIYTPQGIPLAIFKPSHQQLRHQNQKKPWRNQRNFINEVICIALARSLNLGNYTPIMLPIPCSKIHISFRDEPLEGLLEAPIHLLTSKMEKSLELAQFGQFLLNLATSQFKTPTHCLSLANLNSLIDGDSHQHREKLVNTHVQRFKIKGAKDFHYDHYQFFLEHINVESLFRVAVLDMLLFHRDLKPDNVLLSITPSGIHFIATDFEYAMHPFISSTPDPFVEKVTKINFLPFYLDFPQSYRTLPRSYFHLITALKYDEIETFFTTQMGRCLHPEGVEDFKKRFIWLYKIAQDVVLGSKEPLSLRQLHKEFKYTFGLKGKFYKASQHRVKNRYFYTLAQFNLLNPERTPHPQDISMDSELLEFEEGLLDDQAPSHDQSLEREDLAILSGYDGVL